jgi:RNA polymerase sigma-70 factor (ECF subfamily)
MASPPPASDLAALLAKVRGGDEGALMQLLQQYEPRLRTTARVLLGPLLRPHMDSIDLVQSVHRVLLPGLRDGKFDVTCPEQLLALALTVIRRKVAHSWRRLQREQSFPAERNAAGHSAESLLPSRSPQDDPAAAAQAKDEIRHLLDGLPEEDRHLIDLRLQGYSTVEIAGKLNCDAHALRARLSRLRQRLRHNGCTDWL